MFTLFDSLAGVFWSITYALVIVFHCREREMAIPPVAVANNLGWETAALVLGLIGFQPLVWVHAAWFLLDVGIVLTYVLYCRPVYVKRKHAFFVYYAIACTVFFLLFLKTESGMLVSSFVIDLTMALEWFLFYSTFEKVKITNITIVFCAAKLIGDICAWIAYKGFSSAAEIAGIAACFLNAGCLTVAILKKKKSSRKIQK